MSQIQEQSSALERTPDSAPGEHLPQREHLPEKAAISENQSERLRCANAVRMLSVDMIQAANSGHLAPLWVWRILQKCCGATS